MKNITTVRRSVAIMANQLHKLGYTLSNAFKTAWRRIKKSMTCKVSGTSFGNRQQLLQFISSQKKENLTIYLKRDRANLYDKYAVVVGIKGAGYAHIGYVIKGLAQSLASIINKDIPLKASIQIVGGYGYKINYGALVQISLA